MGEMIAVGIREKVGAVARINAGAYHDGTRRLRACWLACKAAAMKRHNCRRRRRGGRRTAGPLWLTRLAHAH